MSNLILRYGIFTTDSDVNIYTILNKLPQQELRSVHSIGDKINDSLVRKESLISYEYTYDAIRSVDEVCKIFQNKWEKHVEILNTFFVSFPLQSFLLFEFDLHDYEFPELIFDKTFINFLAEIKTELQFFFYSGE